MRDNVIRLPYAIASRSAIEWLIRIGYLEAAHRRNAAAIEDAIQHLRARWGGPVLGLDREPLLGQKFKRRS
jgi:hypothetical protein